MADHAMDKLHSELKKELYFKFDTSSFNFLSILKRIFDAEDLSLIHQQDPESVKEGYVTFLNDQATSFHKRFYASEFFEDFLQSYQELVRKVIGEKPSQFFVDVSTGRWHCRGRHQAPQFRSYGEDKIVFQRRPTFRVCLPNNVAVGQKHRDFDYQHPEGEVNFWIPFTKVWESNGLYVESEPEKGDFHAIGPLEFGDIFRFYGNKCWHFNRVNDTGLSRSLAFHICDPLAHALSIFIEC